MLRNYTDCCDRGNCTGLPPDCMCDEFCHLSGDCCHDIAETCNRGIFKNQFSRIATLLFFFFFSMKNIQESPPGKLNLYMLTSILVSFTVYWSVFSLYMFTSILVSFTVYWSVFSLYMLTSMLYAH